MEDRQDEPGVPDLEPISIFLIKLITLGGLNWRLSLPGGGLNIWLRSASSGAGDLPPKDPDGGIIGGGARTGGGASLGGGAT